MTSWNSLLRWDAARMQSTGDELTARLKSLQGLESQLRDAATPSDWDGEAATAAQDELRAVEQRLQDRVAEFAAVRAAVDDAAERIERLHRAVTEVREVASAHQLTISDGVVAASPGAQPSPDRAQIQQALEHRIAQILRTASDVDADLSSVLQAVAEGKVDDDGATTLAAAATAGAGQGAATAVAPPSNGTPADSKAWWDTLTAAERHTLINEHPELIGHRDGIPAKDRHAANMERLPEERQRLETELAAARERGDEETADRLSGYLRGIDAIQGRLDRGDYFLLKLETSGDGQAIVAHGNPDTADNVATYIPGTGADLSKIDGELNRSDLMHAAAGESHGDSESTSVITYMGYDAPDHPIKESPFSHFAHDAKENIDSFQDGLRATHEGGRSHNTVVGYSYGGYTASVAAADTRLDIDELVTVAAPGAYVDNASQLNVGEDHVWATINDRDIVDWSPFHGTDPTEPKFGAEVFESSRANGNPFQAHSEYWYDGNRAVSNIGHIVAGNPEQVTR